MMSRDKFLFLGLPNSGKTTLFSMMMKSFQRMTNQEQFSSQNCRRLLFKGDSSSFIDSCWQNLTRRQWPGKTQCNNKLFYFKLEVYRKGADDCLKLLPNECRYIHYFDYPGEAIEVAFGDGNTDAPGLLSAAGEMKSALRGASGIFLTIDACTLLTGWDAPKTDRILTGLLEAIPKNNEVKIAIIFTKLELFAGKNPDFKEVFRIMYENTYANLAKENLKVSFFTNVLPFGEVEIDENGRAIPPKRIELPPSILGPIEWMLREDC